MTEEKSNRHYGFGDLPHYYDEQWEEDGFLASVMQKELCPICKAHLSTSGICLNACHLGKEGQERFVKMMIKAQEDTS